MNGKKRSFGFWMQGYGLIHKIVPGYLFLASAEAVLNAATAPVNLYLSAVVLSTLVECGGNTAVVLPDIVTLLFANFILVVLKSFLSKKTAVHKDGFYENMRVYLYRKYLLLDYETTQDAAVTAMISQIEDNDHTMGSGVGRLFWTYGSLIECIASIIFLSLISGKLVTTSLMVNGFAPIILVSMIAVVLILNMKIVNVFEMRQKKVFEGLIKTSATMMYYDDYVMDKKREKTYAYITKRRQFWKR